MRREAKISQIFPAEEPRIRAERQSQALIEAFLASGLFFLLLPGTFLGVWNLIGISRHQALTALSPAWLQAHGQAQVFGWVGSFILVPHRRCRPAGDETGGGAVDWFCAIGTEVVRSLVRMSPYFSRTRNP